MRITHAATAALTLTIAVATAAPAHASSKSCGTVGGMVNEVYKVKVTPSSISCTTARSVLNGFRRAQEKIYQEGKRVPSKGVMVKTYRCRAPKAVVAGGYVTQKWICTKGSRSIVGTSTQLYTD